MGWPTWASALDGNVTNWRIPWQSISKQSAWAMGENQKRVWPSLEHCCPKVIWYIPVPDWTSSSTFAFIGYGTNPPAHIQPTCLNLISSLWLSLGPFSPGWLSIVAHWMHWSVRTSYGISFSDSRGWVLWCLWTCRYSSYRENRMARWVYRRQSWRLSIDVLNELHRHFVRY